MDATIIKQIIAAGIAAPSADNSQPWLYSLSDDTIDLYIDKDRSGKLSDTRYLLSDIAIGCVVENLLIQAGHLGLAGKVSIFPEGEAHSPCFPVTIKFEPTEGLESIPVTALYQRHTDRTFPWKGPISADKKQTIQSEAKKIQGANLLWLDKKQRKIAHKALFLAETLRFSNKDFHHELFSSIDFSLDWQQSATEHLAPGALNVEFFAKPIFKLAKSWKAMKILNLFGAAHMFGFRSTVVPSLFSPELALVTIDGTQRENIIQAGRAIQRAWLKATEYELSAHPLASPGVMSLNLFNHSHKNIPVIAEHMNQLSPTAQGVIFFRLGKSRQKHKPLSNRRQSLSFKRPN